MSFPVNFAALYDNLLSKTFKKVVENVMTNFEAKNTPLREINRIKSSHIVSKENIMNDHNAKFAETTGN